jgi:hypothetical protein
MWMIWFALIGIAIMLVELAYTLRLTNKYIENMTSKLTATRTVYVQHVGEDKISIALNNIAETARFMSQRSTCYKN